MTRIPRVLASMTVAIMLVALSGRAARADTVVQVPLPGLLDGRSVTTLTGGKLVVWTVPTDGGGGQNAFATAAVALSKGAPVANALPDDGRFPANDRHPDVVLNFSNDADPASPQTHFVKVNTTFTFAMPPATYSKLFVFFSGAAGGTPLKLTLTYGDATTELKTITIPDYYADVPATDPVIFNLAPDLAKWSKNTTIAEANHHHITGAELDPMAKTLTSVLVDRPGNGYLVFWGATGVATTAVAGYDGDTDAGAPDAGGKPLDAAGTGGASATAGASGASGGAGAAAGASGTAGAAGGAGQTGGTAGTSGGAGATSGGTAGATTSAGSAGTSGAAGAPVRKASGGGCRLAGADDPPSSSAAWLVLGACIAWSVGRRRRRARELSAASGSDTASVGSGAAPRWSV
jgi:hypothetical protein